MNGLEDFLQKFRGKRSSSISSIEFENKDIQREEVVKEVLEIYGGDIPKCYELGSDNSISESSLDRSSVDESIKEENTVDDYNSEEETHIEEEIKEE